MQKLRSILFLSLIWFAGKIGGSEKVPTKEFPPIKPKPTKVEDAGPAGDLTNNDRPSWLSRVGASVRHAITVLDKENEEALNIECIVS